MADVFTKEMRSNVMKKVRSKNTKPELLVRQFLFSKGFRYRLHQNNLPGKPDIVLKKHLTIIFVNGCFWHGHINCNKSTLPASNTTFWKKKIQSNVERDKKAHFLLKKMGWTILTIWECDIKNKKSFNETMGTLLNNLSNISSPNPVINKCG